MAADFLTRADAKAKGLSVYFTNKPCKHGHVAERRTLNGVCIECEKLIEQRYRDRNPDKLREKWRLDSAKARENNPERLKRNQQKWVTENPDKVAAKKKRWREANREKIRADEKRWRDANKEKIKHKNRRYKTENAERLSPLNIERAEQWRLDNIDRARATSRKSRHTRRALECAATGSYTQDQIQDLLESQQWICATPNCGTSLHKSKELDHKMPLSRGGSNGIENLQWLCRSCNRRKRDKDHIEWAQKNGCLL